jgi:hypothetical protein
VSRTRDWLALLLPGDWAVMLLGLLLVATSFALLWRGGSADRAVVRRDGQVVAELPLSAPKKVTIPGAIGDTIVEIQPGRARVLSDPGLHQYCVKQGWLSQAGAIAICAPNHVSLALKGSASSHDSLAY